MCWACEHVTEMLLILKIQKTIFDLLISGQVLDMTSKKKKWNESGFRPNLSTSIGQGEPPEDGEMSELTLPPPPQTQDSKFKSWRSEAKHATSQSRSPPPHNTEYMTSKEMSHDFVRVQSMAETTLLGLVMVLPHVVYSSPLGNTVDGILFLYCLLSVTESWLYTSRWSEWSIQNYHQEHR